jgi:hypothetical protein
VKRLGIIAAAVAAIPVMVLNGTGIIGSFPWSDRFIGSFPWSDLILF